jgi:acetate kinase
MRPANSSSESPDRLAAVLNAGSSSLKYELLTAAGNAVASGEVERIGESGAGPDYRAAVDQAFADLNRQATASWQERVVAIGHRVVHGGPNLYRPTLVDDAVLAEIDRCAALAPLHNPPALKVIHAAQALLPVVPHVAVFDTGFHHDLPLVARTYAIPADVADRWAIRRYGAHGISCEYLIDRLGQLESDRQRVVLAHLGAGASVTAVRDGRSIDTSMGFTPLEGLVMATRSGDLDPAILLYLEQVVGLSARDVAQLLESESGWKGLSGASGDFRVVGERAAAGDERARLAIDLFVYRLRKYLGAYWTVLGGLDALVFAGGIGENSVALRAAVVGSLGVLGLRLDPSANRHGPAERRISPPDAPTTIWVIPTRESLVIARHALTFAK